MGRLLLLACAMCLALHVGIWRVVSAADPTPATPVCGLDGFELDTLDQATYWNMTVEANDCIIPTGYVETNITSCYVYFSICKAIPESICTGHTNSSTCQVVTTDDEHQYIYSIGDFQNVNEFQAIGDKDRVGFTTLRQGDIIQSRLCNGTYSTALTWSCNGLIKWDSERADATSYITTIVGRSIDNCFLEVEFGYSGACYISPTLSPDRCQLPPYDLGGISSKEYWNATVPPEVCYGDEATSCTFHFSFCQAVPPSVGGGCYGASVCQTGTDGDGNTFGYSMGQFNPQFTQFYENDQVVDGGFHMDVENGSRPDDGRCNTRYGIKTRVVLVCNSSVQWTKQDLTDLIEVAYLEAIDPCEYNIFFQYAGACIPVGPYGPAGSSASPVGWIFIGIFLFVVVVYLVVGAGFQFIVRGERGLKVIPNYEFWASFVILVLEGCKFFLDIITCFQFDGRIKAPGKSSVDYDKI